MLFSKIDMTQSSQAILPSLDYKGTSVNTKKDKVISPCLSFSLSDLCLLTSLCSMMTGGIYMVLLYPIGTTWVQLVFFMKKLSMNIQSFH